MTSVIEPHHKGFPSWAVGRPVSELTGLSLTELATPLLLLRVDALEHNLEAMRRFCAESGLSLAPHVKTTMSPQIIARQFEYGAWAATVATPAQARTVRAFGVDRILLANQLVDPEAITWFGNQLDADDAFTSYCYVDSEDGLRLLEEGLAGRRRRLLVIVEVGVPGGRTGVRDPREAVRLAAAVVRSSHLQLAGVGGFEGIIDIEADAAHLGRVTDYLSTLRRVADELLEGWPAGDEFIVTAGGSAFFELVRDAFDARWRAGRRIRVVLRSGCYVTHDSSGYQRYREVMAHRCEPLPLTAALELWARVLSRPEPDLAILDFGKRDAGTDAGFPVPQYVVRRSQAAVEPAPQAEVVALNDQHAYLKSSGRLEVGDLVGFGISHPCTTLDKWRLIPMVDADRRLAGAVRTLF